MTIVERYKKINLSEIHRMVDGMKKADVRVMDCNFN